MKMVEYLKKQYGVVCRRVHLISRGRNNALFCRETNLVGVRDTKGNSFAPETLMIIEQGVKPDQNTANTSRQVILVSEMGHMVRYRAISPIWTPGFFFA